LLLHKPDLIILCAIKTLLHKAQPRKEINMLNRYIVVNLLWLSLGVAAHNTQLQLLTDIASNDSCAKDKPLKQAVNQNLTDIIYGTSCRIDPKLLTPLLRKQQDMLNNDQALLDLWQTHNKNLVDAKFRWIPRVSLATLATSFAWQCYKSYTGDKQVIQGSGHIWALLNNVYVAGLHAGLAFATTGIVMVTKTDLEQYPQTDVALLQNKVTRTQQLCKQLEQLIEKQTNIKVKE
jgi:hypothetical protein